MNLHHCHRHEQSWSNMTHHAQSWNNMSDHDSPTVIINMHCHELSWTVMNHPSSYHSYESKKQMNPGLAKWAMNTYEYSRHSPPKNAQKPDKAFQTTCFAGELPWLVHPGSCHSIEESSQISPTKIIQQLYWDVLDKKRLGFDGSGVRESNQDQSSKTKIKPIPSMSDIFT